MSEEQVAKHKPFVEAMVKKLVIDPMTHLQRAAQSGSLAHVKIALERIGQEPKTPGLKKALLQAQVNLYLNGHNEAGDAVKAFTDKEYRNVQMPSAPEKASDAVDAFLDLHPAVKGGESVEGWQIPMLPPRQTPLQKSPQK